MRYLNGLNIKQAFQNKIPKFPSASRVLPQRGEDLLNAGGKQENTSKFLGMLKGRTFFI